MTEPYHEIAYTVGNPETYELNLDMRAHQGRRLYKLAGGVVYKTRQDAQFELDYHDGSLPPHWFDDWVHRPGRVYLLELPNGWDADTEPDPRGGYRLKVAAALARVRA